MIALLFGSLSIYLREYIKNKNKIKPTPGLRSRNASDQFADLDHISLNEQVYIGI
jgi:hypothetical protein